MSRDVFADKEERSIAVCRDDGPIFGGAGHKSPDSAASRLMVGLDAADRTVVRGVLKLKVIFIKRPLSL